MSASKEPRFNDEQYMADLQKKLGSVQTYKPPKPYGTGAQGMPHPRADEPHDTYSHDMGQRSGAGSRLNASNISEGGFRQNILARLGNAHLEDSQVHSQPDEVYSGDFASAN